jgi:hypothetical protein
MNYLTLRKVSLKILTRVREADYSNYESTPQAKINEARDVFITILEMFAECLPKQVKRIKIVNGIANSANNHTNGLNILTFSSKFNRCCQIDDEVAKRSASEAKRSDYDFDILSLATVKYLTAPNIYLSWVPFTEFQYLLKHCYSWCSLTDRQLFKICDFEGELELIGRFRTFNYYDSDSLEKELDLDFKFIEPLITISAYEYAKRFLKKADIEFLKAFSDEAIAQLRKLDVGYNN